MSQTYLLNTPVLTAYGTWRFSGPLSVAQAQALLAAGFTSAVGHPGTAELLANLLQCAVPFQRIEIHMEPGDNALIFRMKERLPEGKVFSREEIIALPFELGLLERIE